MKIPKVLVLDDDAVSLELYSRELSKNYQVITSETVAQAIEYLASQEFDVVVMEPMVNENGGWAFLSKLCAEPHNIPVILCSVDDDRKAGLKRGAREYLVKPVLPITLHHVVDKVLGVKFQLLAG
jgi:two-component system, chemotaxis family, sensor kinase CheA